MKYIRCKPEKTESLLFLKQKCYDVMLRDLKSSGADSGTRLPGERRLSEKYEMPLSVIRATLKRLREENVLSGGRRERPTLLSAPEPPKTLENATFAVIGYMDERRFEARRTLPVHLCRFLERMLLPQSGRVVFFNLWKDHSWENITRHLAELKPSAIVLALFETEKPPASALKTIVASGIPAAAIRLKSKFFENIDFDNKYIGKLQAEYILSLGHRRVCFVGFENAEWSELRQTGVAETFRKQSAAEPEVFIPHEFLDVKEYMRNNAGCFTAFLCANDKLAEWVVTAAEELHLRVPEDLSVVGIDDGIEAIYNNLTTIRLDDDVLGNAVYELLRDKLLMKTPPVSVRSILSKDVQVIPRLTSRVLAYP